MPMLALLSLSPARAETAEPAQPEALPSVEVVGRSSSGRYHAADAVGAKTELPLRELPQSVRVMTRQAMDDLGATRLDDLLDYVGGVSRQNNFGGLWDNIAIRGLAGNENTGMATLLNGFGSNRGFNAPRDLAGVERIEFLKGPAAALYGSSEPGGTLNVVSKAPLWSAGHSLEAYGGSQGLRRFALDSTGPLGERVAFRLNLASEDRDGFRDHVGSQRRVVAPALTWRLSPSTEVDYRGEWLRHATPLDRGVVAVDGRLGAIPRDRFLGEPADGDVTVRNSNHQLALQHEWTPDWRSRVAVSYRTTGIEGFSTEASALRADGSLTRQRRYRDYDSEDVALQAELQGRLRTGAVSHELLAGMETFRFRMDSRMLRANPTATAPYAIDIHRPVYGQPQPTPLPNTDTLERQRDTAFYLQDAVSLGRHWRVVGGLRWDRYEQSLMNRRTRIETRQTPSEVAPRLGVSWLPADGWTVYASAGRSFRPNTGSDAAGQAFEPEHGRALELGGKWESAHGRAGATVALFDIRKSGVLTADPINSGFSMAAGEVRSRGLELDGAGWVSAHWRINASLVLNDAEVRRDRTLEVGSRLLNVPRVNGSLLAVYENSLTNGQGYGVGGGVTHTGRRLGQARTQAEVDAGTRAFDLPAYTTAKLVAFWRVTPKLRVSLDVDNLFDTTYYASSYSRVWVAPGASRSISLGLQVKL
ncbi:TonB-dependent siderophore receptor [Roseateles amylovorans]|uniref:TonB-dependent siderophore receptor n=1 Tax=Roseateles amylovorans TaxID=2978473 RepID=A0ABY6B0V1_9BURK|nr:TonB-dependent siderophore receptor [Roseateles amylovorans]UXH76955.1 TonB-dependent siderophore receptor [Roseateles amylovorans]